MRQSEGRSHLSSVEIPAGRVACPWGSLILPAKPGSAIVPIKVPSVLDKGDLNVVGL